MPDTVSINPSDAYYAEFFGDMGSFWTRLFQDKRFVSNKAKADSLELSQLYLNLMETAACLNRATVPSFHREKWFPIVIRKSERNSGDGVRLFMGIAPDAVLGPQPPDTAYTAGQEFTLGGVALKSGFVSYTLHASNFQAGINTLSSGIVSPAATYVNNLDYYIARDSVVFKSEVDPFELPDKFPQRVVYLNEVGIDYEIVLWGSDAMVDRSYPYDHFGYMQETFVQDPVAEARLANALLELRAGGTSLFALKKNLGQLFDTPVVLTDGELVQTITAAPDGSPIVITDTQAYRCRPEETLLSTVVVGARLGAGDFITSTVKFYSQLNPDKLLIRTGMTLSQLVSDAPRLVLGSGLAYSAAITAPLSVEWRNIPLTYEGSSQSGKPLIAFRVSGDNDANALYWDEVWRQAEEGDISLADVFSDYLYSSYAHTPGYQIGTINAMDFVLRNFMGANTSILVVDFVAAPEYIKTFNAIYELDRVLPAHSVLLIIAKIVVAEDNYGGRVAEGTIQKNAGRKLSQEGEVSAIEHRVKIKEIPTCLRDSILV